MTLIVNISLWDWKLGLQREVLLHSQGSVCCEVTSERHSCLTLPYGIESLDCKGKVCCIIKWWHVFESRVRDTHMFNSCFWGWKLGLQREGCSVILGMHAMQSWVGEYRCCSKAPYGIGSLDSRGKVRCILKGTFAVES